MSKREHSAVIRSALLLLLLGPFMAAFAQSDPESDYEREIVPVVDPSAPLVEQFKVAYAAYQQGEADRYAGKNTRLAVKRFDFAELSYNLGKKLFPERDSENRMNLAINFARVHDQRGNYQEAEKLYREGLKIAERVVGANSVQLVPLLVAIGEADNKWSYSNVFKADQYRRAVAITEQHFGADSLEYAQIMLNVGAQAYAKGSSSAYNYYHQAINVLQPMEGHLAEKAHAYLGFAKVELQRGDESDAIDLFQQSLTHALSAPQDPATVRLALTIRAFLIQAYRRSGQDDLAQEQLAFISHQDAVDIGYEGGLIYRPKAEYPEAAARAGEEGTVHLRFLVGTEGRVSNIQLTNAEGFRRYRDDFIESVIEMAENMQFAPKRVNGRAISYSSTYRYRFYQID